MKLRKPFWITAISLVVIAGAAVFLVLVNREEVTQNTAVTQCQAIDHFVQIQEYLTSVSPTLDDRQKQLRVNIYENFRAEQERTVSPECRDPLDPDVIVQAVRAAEGS